MDLLGINRKVYVFPFQCMSSYIDLSYDKKVVAKIVALPQQIFDKNPNFLSVNSHIFTYVTLYADIFMFLNTFEYFVVFYCPNIVSFARYGVQMSKNSQFGILQNFPIFLYIFNTLDI